MNVFFVSVVLFIAVGTQAAPLTKKGNTYTLPHLTGCFSREMVTFQCQWDLGSRENSTNPGDVGLFYTLKKDSEKSETKWYDCPSYSSSGKNKCFFNSSNTIIWYPYAIQLRSRSLGIVYDEMSFSVEQIVFPDPPVGLNWTLLKISSSGLVYDVVVSWEPPPSAAEEIKMGWMMLVYETQYRENGSSKWNLMDNDKETKSYIYGLNSNTDYEVRVRSKMRGYNFGDFSDSFFIHVPDQDSQFPLKAVLIFTVVGIVMILVLVVVSRQQRIMVIFLPPIPGPKIKGIDPILLQKGQIKEFTSILGTHPSLRPELYSNDPWVEFIEVDIDEPHDSQEELLIADSPVSDSPQMSSVFRDDDSGRASCCDPDFSDHDHTDLHQSSASSHHDGFHPLSHEIRQPASVCPQDPTWSTSLYSQVSDVTRRGEVLLSPEDQELVCSTSNADKKDHAKKETKQFCPDDGGYTSEPVVGELISNLHAPTTNDSEDGKSQLSFTDIMNPNETQLSTAFTGHGKAPCLEYTMVDGVDWQNSLLLKPSQPAVVKTVTAPDEYLTAELIGNMPFN